jgi:hypothetical protein
MPKKKKKVDQPAVEPRRSEGRLPQYLVPIQTKANPAFRGPKLPPKPAIRVITSSRLGVDPTSSAFVVEAMREFDHNFAHEFGILDLGFDCLGFSDKQNGERSKCFGENEAVLQAFVNNNTFDEWIAMVRAAFKKLIADNRHKTVLNVAFFCNGGKHRSVAGAYIFQHSLENDGYSTSTVHMARATWTHGLCFKCFGCTCMTKLKTRTMSRALGKWQQSLG